MPPIRGFPMPSSRQRARFSNSEMVEAGIAAAAARGPPPRPTIDPEKRAKMADLAAKFAAQEKIFNATGPMGDEARRRAEEGMHRARAAAADPTVVRLLDVTMDTRKMKDDDLALFARRFNGQIGPPPEEPPPEPEYIVLDYGAPSSPESGMNKQPAGEPPE